MRVWPEVVAVMLAGTAAMAANPSSKGEDFGDLITVTAADCRRLVAAVPAADVEYRPGVDTKGRPVAPADLAGSPQIKLPDPVVHIQVDLAGRYGIPAVAANGAPGAYGGKVDMGQVTVKDGRAYFNGQPLAPLDQEAIADACKKKGGVK